MQDMYAGDVGDYGKFHILRCLENKMKVGVNWYYVESDDSDDGKKTNKG